MNKLKCIGWVNVYKGRVSSIFATRRFARHSRNIYELHDYLRTVRVYVVRGKGKKK
jgi:hypothetical protein